MEPIRRFDPALLTAVLEDWEWLGLDGAEPLFASPFGDLFLSRPDGAWFLDVNAGTLTRVADDVAGLQDLLNTAGAQADLLKLPLAQAGEAAGLVPGETDVYSFTHPPVLGGDYEPGNLEIGDLRVIVGILGQIHPQVRDLPEGTQIRLSIGEEPAPAKPKRGLFRRRG